MKEVQVTLKNDEGLHARAAAVFVRKANQFSSNITLTSRGEDVNGKSIIGIMSLGVFSGQEISIMAEGSDEAEAVQGLKDLVENEINK